MSVTQQMRVPAPTSVPKHMSCAVLIGKPQWVWTIPFGLPVVPEVYSTSSGSSASVDSTCPLPESRSSQVKPVAVPERGTTTTCCTDGQRLTAANTISCEGVNLPLRGNASDVI